MPWKAFMIHMCTCCFAVLFRHPCNRMCSVCSSAPWWWGKLLCFHSSHEKGCVSTLLSGAQFSKFKHFAQFNHIGAWFHAKRLRGNLIIPQSAAGCGRCTLRHTGGSHWTSRFSKSWIFKRVWGIISRTSSKNPLFGQQYCTPWSFVQSVAWW